MVIEPQSLIGTWRRFGSAGPLYEVVGLVGSADASDPLMRVRRLETDEEIDYPMSVILSDPRES